MASELTIVLRDRVADQVSRLPNPQEFVHQADEQALRKQAPKSVGSFSLWARVVTQIEGLPGLGEHADILRKDQEKLRRSFRLKHDEP